MGKKRAMTQETKDRLRAQKAAYKLRTKVKKGTATAEDRERLAALESSYGGKAKRATVREDVDTDHDSPHDEPVAASPGADTEGAGEESVPPDRDSPPPPPPPRPDPDPPPRVEVLPKSGSANWRDKYRQNLGREGACVAVASLYCGVLGRMSAYVASTGARPLFGSAELSPGGMVFSAAVLTTDALLPADFELTPPIELTMMSAMATGQAVMVAARQKAKQKGPNVSGNTWRASSPPPPPPPSSPPAEPVASPEAPSDDASNGVHIDTGRFHVATEMAVPKMGADDVF